MEEEEELILCNWLAPKKKFFLVQCQVQVPGTGALHLPKVTPLNKDDWSKLCFHPDENEPPRLSSTSSWKIWMWDKGSYVLRSKQWCTFCLVCVLRPSWLGIL